MPQCIPGIPGFTESMALAMELRCFLRKQVGWGGHVYVPCTSYMKYFYSAEITGIVYYVTCLYAAEISGIVYYVKCCYVIVYSGIVYCDDAKKPKNAPQVFPGFPIIKSARHCGGKITIFLKNVRFMGTVPGPAGSL